MSSIRVVLAGIPNVLGDVITEIITTQPDMSVVASLRTHDGVPAAVERTGASVVILGVDADAEAAIAISDELLYDRPRLTVLTVTTDGRETALHLLRPHDEPLGQVSPQRLIAALRTRGPAHRGVPSTAFADSTEIRCAALDRC